MAETLTQMHDLHARLDALRMQQQRLMDVGWGMEGMNPVVPDQFEAFYAGRDDLRDDRAESTETSALAQLHDRLDQMQQAQRQERGHEQGLEY